MKAAKFSPLTASIRLMLCGSVGLTHLALPSIAFAVERFAPLMGSQAEGFIGISPESRLRSFDSAWSDLGELLITSDKSRANADGQSVIKFKVKAIDKQGKPLQEANGIITIEVDGARIRLASRLTSETGPDAGDIDRVAPGVQVRLEKGEVEFEVLAPSEPKDVKVRVSAGDQVAEGLLTFSAELREMLAVGIVEAKLAISAKQMSGIQPVRSNDAFDRELRALSRSFANDKAQFGSRAAFFLKGKVKGDYLLTLALDTDKPVRDRIFRDIDPNAFYPVYGDASERGFDARSSTRLYVRVDRERSYLLYGDHNPASAVAVRKLGQYARAMNGIRYHHETASVLANAYVSRDSTKQVIDEFPARGVSGPYGLTNGNSLAFSERVELVVRDRNQPAVILRTTLLSRFADYEFEPFSGQLLFKSPIPSIDEFLNPISIRVTYEVDQAGPKFWFYGADAQYKVNQSIEIGGSFARDHNPFSPFTLKSVNVSGKLGERTKILAEIARTDSVINTNSLNATVIPGLSALSGPVAGNAARVELQYDADSWNARAFAGKSDPTFNNRASSLNGGREEAGLRITSKVTDVITVRGEAIHTADKVTGGKRDGLLLTGERRFENGLKLELGVRKSRETITAASAGSIGITPLSGNTNFTSGFGVGPTGVGSAGNSAIDPVTGLPVFIPGSSITLSSANSIPTNPVDVDLMTLRAKASYRPSDKSAWGLFGEAERDVQEASRKLIAVGGDYQFSEKGRAYLRHELASTLSGQYALNPNQRSQNTVLGFDTRYMQDGQVFNEYRLRDSINGQEAQAAVGLRNLWNYSETLRFTTNVERLHTLSGTKREATVLGGGFEYMPNALWKGSGRLEWRQDTNYTNWLSTLSMARKLNRDWTMLVRNYLSITEGNGGLAGSSGTKVQDRAIVGVAYRDTDTNLVNALARYELRTEKDSLQSASQGNSTARKSHIISAHADYHPTRRWWHTGRIAAKWVDEKFTEGVTSNFAAQLVGARTVYDIDKRWSVGAQANILRSSTGRQYAYGVEVGYIVAPNTHITVGYNFRGFNDKDLIDSNYTNRGIVLGMRWKFDEETFGKKETK
jgi:hypothetical protein